MKREHEYTIDVPPRLRKLWGGARQVRFVTYWDAKRRITITRGYKVKRKV